jgi:hypothetical protein
MINHPAKDRNRIQIVIINHPAKDRKILFSVADLYPLAEEQRIRLGKIMICVPKRK